jgi:hypothetical protein
MPPKVTISADDAVRAAAAKKPIILTPHPDELDAMDDEVSVVSEVPAVVNHVNPDEDTLDQFERKVSHAKITNATWVETTDNVISTFVPKGLGEVGYFIYKNVRVCPKGKAAEIQRMERDRKHEGTVDFR